MKKIFLFSLSLILVVSSFAQTLQKSNVKQLIAKNAVSIGFSKVNIDDYAISSAYKSSDISYVYLQQLYNGLPVRNSMKVLSFKEDNLASNAGTFLDNIDAIATTKSINPTLRATEAVNAAFAHQKLVSPVLNKNALSDANKFDFGQPYGVTEKVTGELIWFPLYVSGKVVSVNLIWTVVVAPKGTDDMWQIFVDATTGSILGKENLTVKDNWGHNNDNNVPFLLQPTSSQQDLGIKKSLNIANSPYSPTAIASAGYLVIPYPAESPTHTGGTAAVRNNPWTAAPGNATTLGWQSNGTTDYTITRGNNAWATEDRAATNQNTGLPATSSTGPDPLTFNFPPNYTTAPTTPAFQQFATTNLFYWNNIMHDISYNYGFDEVAGNFQANNQGRGGNGGDDVIALAQSGAGVNNANFSTPVDGGRGRMRMYLFDAPVITKVHVNAPAAAIADYAAVESNFSAANLLSNVGPVTGEVVIVQDAAGGLSQACTAPVNSLTGKIAIINRGNCNFTVKVKLAQDAGAIGVIMVNNVATAPIIMGGGPDNTIVIPAVMVSQADGAILADLVPGVNVTLSSSAGISRDGDLDNGIISHEYGHGISTRLTGGPANSSCLGSNATSTDGCNNTRENGSEGWSDYFGLMVTTNWATTQLTDGGLARPIGTYAFFQTPTGGGIRIKPYSTNLTLNPQTYANVGDATYCGEIHNIGEVWCSAIWEMTWGIIQQEGVINPNLYNYTPTNNGGNVIAMKLVMEGLKLQPCNPGFVDQRDAILAADRNLYAGRHACSMWTAFAKRGLGYGANQGSSNSCTDQTASQTLPPAPTITTQPVDVTVAAAANATFTASAGADVNLIYQWQVSTNGGTSWTNVVPSVISPTLTLNAVTAAMNGYKYRCNVFIGCAITVSSIATLTVTGGTVTPPAITTQPTTTAICAGTNATFTAAASGTSNTYSWEVSTNGGTSWTAVSPAATTTTLTLTAVPVSFNNYQYRLVVTNTGGTATSNAAILTVNAAPAAPTVTSPVTYCQNATATALTATGTNLLWYAGATGGTGSATSPTPSTTAAGSTTYYVSQTVNTCEGPRASIVVTINATPAAPSVTTPITYCQNATATALTATGTNLKWYTTLTGGTGSSTAPTPITTTVGSTSFYVSQTIGSCEGSRATIVVTITAPPSAPTVTTPINYCQGLTAVPLTATGSNLLWYNASSGGTGSATAPTPSTATVGSTTYYVSQTTGCESPRAAIVVNVIAGTTAPTVTTPITYCQNATATALTATGSNLLWYAAATGGTGTATAPTPITTAAGSTIYYVSQTSGSCESPRAAITVNVTATPASPTVISPVSYCQGATATALTATGSNLLWYNVSSGGAGAATAPTPSTTALGSTNYYVSQTVSSCEGTRANIVVNITAVPAAPTVTTPVVYCQGATATSLIATGSNLLWYTTLTGGVGSATSPTPSTSTVGSTNYYVSQTTGCESPRATITVTINTTPAAPTATSPTYCQGATSTALTATGTNILWYTVATGGTGSATAPTPLTTTVGSSSFYVSQTTGSCESPRTLVTVTVNATPAAPTVVTPINYCQNAIATPLTATGTNLKWYTVSSGGVGSATAPTPSTTALGSTSYYVSQTTGTCEGPRATIVVTVSAAPAAPTATTPITYCQNSTASALTATGTNLLWYTTMTGGTGSATAPTPSTTTIGSVTYYVSQTGTCESGRTAIIVNVTATAAAPTVTSPISYCQGSTATSLTATGTNLKWYAAATGATVSATAPIPSTTATGATSYFVSQTTGSCESPRAEIVVNITSAPAITTQPQDITSCATSTTFNVVATGTGLTYQWFLSTDGGTTYSPITGATNSTVTITGLTSSQSNYKYRVVVSSGTCTAATSSSVTAKVGTSPVVVLTASPNASSFNPYSNGGLFTTVSPIGNYTYQWKRNNAVISNITPSLTKANGLLDEFGSYIVTVTDASTGCFGTSNAISVSDVADALDRLFITPNPTQGKVKIWYYSNANTAQAKSINVFDSKGARVMVKELAATPLRYGNVEVDLTGMARDTYIFILLDSNGKIVATEKVVRN